MRFSWPSPNTVPQYIPLGRRYLLKKSDDFAASCIVEACLRRGSAKVVLEPPFSSPFLSLTPHQLRQSEKVWIYGHGLDQELISTAAR